MNPSTLTRESFAKLPTEADYERGQKDIEVETVSGEKRAVRLTRPAERVRTDLIQRVRASKDAALFVHPTLEAHAATPDFLPSLTPLSRSFLTNAAAIMCAGSAALEALKALCRDEPGAGPRKGPAPTMP